LIEQKRGGKIVNTIAVQGLTGNIGQVNYSTANGAVIGLSKALAVELKKYHVQVNMLCPIAKTRLTEDLPMFHAMSEAHYGPQFVAQGALFLASSLGGDLSGEILAIAGSKASVWKTTESLGLLSENPNDVWTPQQLKNQWFALSK